MKVSVITTCYNRGRTIAQAAGSVLSQDYDNLEYIVVDGKSTDNTLEELKRELAAHKGRDVKVISEPDNGLYEGLNKGIRMATGDIIGIGHSDDFLFDEHVISSIADKFETTGADMVYANGIYVDEHDTSEVVRVWRSGQYEMKNVKKGWLPLHPTVFIRRDTMLRLGLYDERYKISADSDLLVRYLYDNKDLKVAYLDRFVVVMRMGGLSTDLRKFLSKWREDFIMYRSHGIFPFFALPLKILRKVPQFFIKIKEKNNESQTLK